MRIQIQDGKVVEKEISKDNVFCKNITFSNDKYNLQLEGYVANSAHLNEEKIIAAYEKNGFAGLLSTLKGSFYVIFEDSSSKEIYISNDLLSKRPLYYMIDAGQAIMDSSYTSMLDRVKKSGCSLEVDYQGLKQITRYGAFLLDNTYYKQIKYLMHNQYIKIAADGTLDIVDYEYIRPSSIPDNEDTLIDYLDTIFENACKNITSLNITNGFKPSFSISGGMDSRCVLLKSIKGCREKNITPFAFSYGARGCKDLEIASGLAEKYHCDYMDHNINYDEFLTDRDELIKTNECQINYPGSTGLHRTLKHIDTSNIGIFMTGLGGGEIFGDLRYQDGDDNSDDKRYRIELGRIYDAEELDQVIESIKKRYKSYNQFITYNDIRTNQNFAYTSRGSFEVFSPYQDEEFYTALMAQSYETLQRRRLYTKWYNSKIVDDSPVTYAYYEGKIRAYKTNVLYRKCKSGIELLLKPFRRKSWQSQMNPYDEWIMKSENTQKYFEDTFNKDIAVISKKDKDLAAFIEKEYSSAGINKTRVLTASGLYSIV